MSYVLSGCIIDLAKLRSVVGSGDASIVDAVKANAPEAFEDEEEYADDDEPVLSEALRGLVMGDEIDPDNAFQYGYALQELCDYLGEMPEVDIWGGVGWGAVEVCGLEELLTKTGSPVPIPLEDGDFPAIGHINREQVGAYLQAANKRLQNSTDGEADGLLDEYIAWLETADEQKLDIVFFYH